MRKLSILLSLVVILSFVLAACGGTTEETAPAFTETPSIETELPNTGVTEVPTTEAPVVTETEAPTLAATETTGPLITEAPSVAETAMPGPGVAGTPGAALPPLGFADPSRLTTLMTFDVRNANGDTLATVDDMVIDLGSSQILHVVLASGGFLGIGESLIPVPWNAMQVNPECVTAAMGGTGTTTGGAAATGTPGAVGGTGTGADTCYFLLNVDDETLRNAPNVDLDNLPDINTPGWDTEFNTYWETAGTTGAGTAGTETPAAGGTATPVTGAQAGSRLILASNLLGMPVTAGTAGAGGTGGTTGGAAVTGTPSAGGTSGTTGGTAAGTVTPGTGGIVAQGEALGVVTDAIVDLQTGMIHYLLVTVDMATLGTTGSLIPVPAQAFQAGGDAQTQMLTLNVDPSVLAGAPAFEEGTLPNATVEDWDTQLNTYWETQGFTTTTSP